MILSKDGELFSWGLGLCGQLGFSYEDIHQNDLRVAQLNHPMTKKIDYKSRVQFGAPSFSQNIMKTPGSKSKANADIQHDLQTIQSVDPDGIYLYDQHTWIPFVPSPIKINIPHSVKHIACGAFHSMILTDEGKIFGCGLANSGQLGIVEESLQAEIQPCSLLYAEFTPVQLDSASGIIQIECGENYSLALSQGGNVYSTGFGAYGIHG